MLNHYKLKDLVKDALLEDMGPGDLTTLAIVAAGQQGSGEIILKEDGVIAGLPVARAVFQSLDEKVFFEALVKEGERITEQTVIACIKGNLQAILSAERTALNYLQRLSGIATITARYVSLVEGYPVTLVDTRKTTPGMRLLEKYATRVGGAVNHRLGLYDAVLIKENHIRAAGSLTEAVRRARRKIPLTTKIEVEVTSLSEFEEALTASVDIVMLDNMTPAAIRKAVQKAKGKVKLEASGGIKEEDLRHVAASGVDYISVGALTHSAPVLDMSLLLTP